MAKDKPEAFPVTFDTALGRAEFELFTSRLVGLARGNLDNRLQHKIDPEEVVQSAYRSFFRQYGQGLLAAEGIDNLWALLTVITLRKCADRVRYFRTDARDLNREAATPRDDSPEPWREAISHEPTPEHAAVLNETISLVCGGLSEAEMPVFEMCLQGYSTQEISQQLGRSERTVRRLREHLKKHLEKLQAS